MHDFASSKSHAGVVGHRQKNKTEGYVQFGGAWKERSGRIILSSPWFGYSRTTFGYGGDRDEVPWDMKGKSRRVQREAASRPTYQVTISC